ncbi:MAG: Bax inhibitor-1/YccA family protein [Holosporales bacterium]|nr:Bax inhibitor-1/YccA family protein [Holosporales bacterium]
MIKNTNVSRGPISSFDGGLQKYMRSVFTRMFMALCLTGIVAMICVSSPEILDVMTGGFSVFLMLATFGIVMYLSFRINKIPLDTANALFWVYSALIGAFLSPLCLMYTGSSIANCFFMTSTFFGGMSLLGYTTKKDLTSIGSFMFVGLMCLIICSFVNAILLHSGALQLGLSAITLVIFAGLTAYDVQKIKQFYNSNDPVDIAGKKAVLGALNLYMDFINIFLAMLRIFGNRR